MKKHIKFNLKIKLALCLFAFFTIEMTYSQCANFGTADSQDYDCDGVININDLDDDNDGILDTDECTVTLADTTFKLFSPPNVFSPSNDIWNVNVSGNSGTTITFNGSNYTIPASGVLTIPVTGAETPLPGENVVESGKSLLMTASEPVTIIHELTGGAASDSWVVLPKSLWGTSYRLFSYTFSGNALNTQYAMILSDSEANDVVIKNKAGVVQKSFTLNTGQSYLQSGLALDMTGWTVTSTSEIGVIVGVNCANSGSGACDNIDEMLLPTSFLGDKYYVPNGANNTTYVMAEEAGTTVTIDGVLVTTLANPGDVYSFDVLVTDLKVLETSSDVTVWQLSPNNTDPAWLLVLDEDKAVKNFNFSIPSSMTSSNILSLIVPTVDTSLIRYNGNPVVGWTPYPSEPSTSYVEITGIAASASVSVTSTTNGVQILSSYVGTGSSITNSTAPSIGSFNLTTGMGSGSFVNCADTDNDGTPNYFDVDSDGDGCSDANEAYGLATADGADGNMYYGVGAPPAVNPDGTVIGASYTGTTTAVTSPPLANITTQPLDQSTDVAGSATISVIVSGGTPSFQWQESTDDGATWSDIVNGGIYSNATTASLTLTGVTALMDGYDYQVEIEDPSSVCTSIFSSSANLCLVSTSSAALSQTCGLVTVVGNVPVLGTGTWSIVSGIGGSFALATNPTTTFSGVDGTAYVLRWTVTNTTCSTTFDLNVTIIADLISPVADVAVLADVTAECSVTSLTAPTATDNCAGMVVVTNDASLPISGEGTTTVVTWTYDDGNGNTNTQTQNVVIDDVTAPVADVAVLADVTAECSVTSLNAPTATDNCAGMVTVTNDASLPILGEGTTTVVTWTYDDGNGNTSIQLQNVVIDDVTAPVADIAILVDVTAECSVASLSAPTTTDNCIGMITATSDAILPISGEGTTTVVTWTYNDGNGNTSIQLQNVIIDDITAPVADVAVLADVTAECSVTSLSSPTATDNCAGMVIVTNDAVLPITTQGTTVVTWTYDDGNGNTSTQTQNVVIDDVTVPVADVAVLADVTAECSVTSLVAPTATDNCAGMVVVTNDASLPISGEGTTTVVTWTYDDGNGNTSIQLQNVIIDDVTAPVADVAILADVTAECSVTSLTAPTATDNCAAMVTVTNDASLPISGEGTTTVVTWTYDDGNGNTSIQTQNVVIDDVTAPVADVAVLADVTAECSVTSLSAPTATDNCGGMVTVTNDASLPITTQGTTVVTWTYDDGNGNTSTQTQNVVIDDVTAPVANVAVLADVTAECSVTSLSAPTATDNCGGMVVVTNDASLPISGEGTTTVVTWTYDDGNGNTITQTQNVVIDDVTVPVADVAVLADVTAECSVTSLVALTATDNCGGMVTVTNDASLPITAQGTTVVTWTYDDGNGNTSTQTQNVVITDVTVPIVLVQNITISLDDLGEGSIIPSDIDNGSSDNCSFTLSLDIDTFDCFNIGNYNVVLSAEDIGGNISTATAIVTIIGDDNDNDAIVDACDEDDDNDGVLDDDDNCHWTYNPDQVDLDQDNIGDLCDDFVDIIVTANDTITPNGDGFNDTWHIANLWRYPNAIVKVFNRHGVKVFEGRNYKNDWNTESTEGGNGKLPVNSYYYTIDLNQPEFGKYGVTPITGWMYINY